MNRTFFLLLCVIALLPGGCNLAPTYSRPEAPVPADWPGAPASAQQAAADVLWREFFVDERLRQVIDLALANNRDLRVAALNIERTQAFYRIQRAELLPTVDARGTFSKERVPYHRSWGDAPWRRRTRARRPPSPPSGRAVPPTIGRPSGRGRPPPICRGGNSSSTSG